MTVATIQRQPIQSAEEFERHIQQLMEERESHIKAAEVIDRELVDIHTRLTSALQQNGKLGSRQQRTIRVHRGVRENSGTGKILGLIKKMAKGNPPHVSTKDVATAAENQFKVKYPHSSFQSLQTAGIIKLGSPERGQITLMKK